ERASRVMNVGNGKEAMHTKSRAATLLAGALLAGFTAAATAQQDYPKRPVRIISPYAPGGGNTIMARLVGDQFTQAWGQQVIVDNRPGGNTIIGTELAARATPDGYTYLLAGSAHVLVPLVFKAPFDPIADFAAVGGVGKYEFILVGSPKLPANDLQQLIALAKAKPEQVTYATFGAGTTTHLSMELLGNLVGARMNHIPFKGTGPALTALLGGHVDVFLSTAAPVVPHLQAGRLKGLAISGEKRSEAVPNVPTFAEAGLPGYEARGWYGVVAPA